MIVHLLLFDLRDDLSDDDRRRLIGVLNTARKHIPTLRRVRIGRRTHEHDYKVSVQVRFEYVAFLEFDDVAGLRAYLEHPAHRELAERFGVAVRDDLIADYELLDELDLANP